MKDAPRISVARIIKAQGNRGEVAADLLTDFPERFAQLHEVELVKDTHEQLNLVVESSWLHKKRVILKFHGINSIDQAKQLAGYDVTVPDSEKHPLPANTYYQHDLIGCAVVSKTGRNYGEVIEVVQFGPNYLLKIRGIGREFLVPFAEKYLVDVNLGQKLLRCDLPEGLEEL